MNTKRLQSLLIRKSNLEASLKDIIIKIRIERARLDKKPIPKWQYGGTFEKALMLLARGKTEKQVAKSLSICVATVRGYKHFAIATAAQVRARVVVELNADTPCDKAGFGCRTTNILYNAGIETLGQLASKTAQEMFKYRNFGRVCCAEVAEVLSACNPPMTLLELPRPSLRECFPTST